MFADRYIVEIIDAARSWLAETAPASARTYHEEAHGIILDIELEAAARTDPFPEVPAYLERLSEAGFKLGVVTRNCRAAVLETYPAILDRVDVVHARDDVTHLKPDPRHLSATLEALSVTAEQAAIVGDGRLDMTSGAALGMYCVGVLTGSCNHAELASAGADLVLNHVSEFAPTRSDH